VAHPLIGLLFTGLIVKTALSVAIIAGFIWIIIKLGKLTDAYTEKLRAK